MLKLRTNTKNTEVVYDKIEIVSFSSETSGDTYIITFETNGSHNLLNNEYIRLRRIDGPNINYTIDVQVNVIDKNHFSIKVDSLRPLYFSFIGKMFLSDKSGEGRKIFVGLESMDEFPHNMAINREDVVLFETVAEDNEPTNVCPDYCFLYNGMFLYKGTDFSLRYNLDRSIIINNESYQVLIPYLESNQDNRFFILKEFETKEEADDFITLVSNNSVSCVDEMFFENSFGGIHLQDGVFLERRRSVLKAMIGVVEDYSFDYTDTANNNGFDNQIELNSPIDYEKQTFYPCIINDSGLTELVNKIVFKLHFRDRYYNKILSENWTTDDSKYWMQYNKVVNGALVRDDTRGGDSISDLGYTKGDVLYRRNNFTKSFIRLLFYDTNDTRTQSLLAYYSAPFDANEMFSKVTSQKKELSEIEPNIEINGPENGFSGSEGFNIHLFPNILEGKTEEFIYLRIEFNHAKYGQTLKMSFPTKDDSLLDFESSDFPITYYNTTDERVELERLMEDMYIKVGLRYDYDRNCYLWYPVINDIAEDGVITFNAFEPRVND